MTEADKPEMDEMNPETPQHAHSADDAARTTAESVDGTQTDESVHKSANESAHESASGQANEATDEPINSTEPTDLAALSHEELLARLNEINTENAQMKDGLLRSKAEMENIRRRSQNEIVAARKFAIEGFAQELLGVKDSLDQASSVELDESASEAVQKMKEGLNLTLKQLDLAMTRFAVVEVEAGPGVRFDPQLHQAISMTPSDEVEANHIVAVVQKGFQLKDRLLRPAMVVVAEDKNRDV